MTNTALRIILVVNGYPPDNWITAAITAFGSLQNPQILLHELGHAFAAGCVLEKSAPTIQLSPFIGGSTLFKVSNPTPLGKKLGETNIRPFIAGAGPLLSLSFSTLQLLLAPQLFSYAPEISAALLTMASLINFCFPRSLCDLGDFSTRAMPSKRFCGAQTRRFFRQSSL